MPIRFYQNDTFIPALLKSLSVGNCSFSKNDSVSGSSFVILPGLVDVHVHLREPGFSYKETIRTGTQAAAHGGICAVASMPNLNPVSDSAEHLRVQTDLIRKDAVIRVYPYGSITKEEAGKELSDMEEISGQVLAFSDDGKGVQNDDMMESAMRLAKRLGKPIVAHCEDNTLLHGGYIHDGEYARRHGHKGISSESEWRAVERDLELVRKTGCAYHVCHVSTKESVELIRQAKRQGLDVTCETAPHYLLLDERDLREEGRFKMNPPLREPADREALIEGLLDGTVDMIVTDHAPHAREEKARGLSGSAMGVVGLETSFPLLYTYLVKKGIVTLEQLVEWMHDAPCRRFGISTGDDFTVFDLSSEYKITEDFFLSMGKSTPFEGWPVNGKCLLTVSGGKVAYLDPKYGG